MGKKQTALYRDDDEALLADASRFLPVAFVLLIISTLYSIYMFYHVLPRMEVEFPAFERDPVETSRIWTETVVLHVLLLLQLVSFIRAMLTSPGDIPHTSEWQLTDNETGAAGGHGAGEEHKCIETKGDGARRTCKWCAKAKPDRAHHCRVCKSCVRKMDHHCPWIFNCVGYRNQKFFFLLVLYSVLCLQFMFITMLESTRRSTIVDTPFMEMFMLVFGQSICAFLGFLLTMFLLFHTYLVSRNMSTIEFCEKYLKSDNKAKVLKAYDRGLLRNWTDVLGTNPLLWFLPVSTIDEEGGLYFAD
jgi:hypothetical protein